MLTHHDVDFDSIEDLQVQVTERVGDLSDREILLITLANQLTFQHTMETRMSEIDTAVSDLATAVVGLGDRITIEVNNLTSSLTAAQQAQADAQAAAQAAVDKDSADVATIAADQQTIADLQAQVAASLDSATQSAASIEAQVASLNQIAAPSVAPAAPADVPAPTDPAAPSA
jgi:hypothetical protein